LHSQQLCRTVFAIASVRRGYHRKEARDLDEGLRRINEYAFPLEDARAMEAYGIHSGVNKVLIINREIVPGRITVVLVDEVIGF
jgi:hypothetical protein